MEERTKGIKSFSKFIYTTLSIVFVVLLVATIVGFAVWLWSATHLPTALVEINGRMMEVPYLFKIGNFEVFLPVIWESGFDFDSLRLGDVIPTINFGDLLRSVFILVGLSFAKDVFKRLREDGSPFRKEVVSSLKRFAIALLALGTVSGVVSLLAAAAVWVVCLIFEYGCMLQNESDTTL
ncbi:MAG: hypothetical protein LBR83_04170 [Clostridiales bacterium]|jgi:hypothetical protein|nr:hypothetical protein [Clostridiales bacterium]